ncbi:MAG TPA: hypothetical protein VD835_18645 [Pyrinomonadaceae bacterium]|nr:hypothetical protein [Pyrinomonadaceae bacterium]
MTPQARKGCLASIRDDIASMRVIKCRMAHERVVAATALSQPPVDRGPLYNFKRVGLCSPDERAGRLGCSHTMSRTKLDRAINELEPGKAEQLGHELNWISNEIHLLDHLKGKAEARLASARREARAGSVDAQAFEILKETEEVTRLERQHDEYVERIGVLRDRVVSEIERLLGEIE